VTVTLLAAEEDPVVLSVITDITERRRAEAEMARVHQQTAEILESINEAFYTMDKDLTITYVNQKAEEILHRHRADLLGKNVWEAFPEAVGGDSHRNFLRALRERVPVNYETFTPVLQTWVESNVYPTAGGGISVFFRDISERKQAEANIRQLNERLEERVQQRTEELARANKELEAFSYSVSHDLKAPLRLISGLAGILMRQGQDNLTERQKESLQTIQVQVARMDALIKALLEFSRLTRKELRLEEVDTLPLVEEVVAEQRQIFGDEAGQRVTVDLSALPAVQADPVLLRTVFTNLLANAFKFTSKVQEPKITIDAEEQDKLYRFCIRDNGVGFPRGHTEKLFKVFQLLHGPGEFEGTGIGLASVRKIIERHGGQVFGEGDEGKGAMFCFTLPAPSA
jgi:PAS domain S-box-containing protein